MKGERDLRKRALFIKALQAGQTVIQAEKTAGLGRRTAYIWCHRGDKELHKIIAKASAKREEERKAAKTAKKARPPARKAPIVARLPVSGDALIDSEVLALRRIGLRILQEIAEDPSCPSQSRVTAAKALTDHAERWEARKDLINRAGPSAPSPVVLVAQGPQATAPTMIEAQVVHPAQITEQPADDEVVTKWRERK